MTPADLQPLIAKLTEAKAGTRALDAEIGAALRIFPSDNPPSWVTNWAGPFVAHPEHVGFVALGHSDGELGMHWRAEPITTSVDAILALIEKRLPGVMLALYVRPVSGECWVRDFGGPCSNIRMAKGPTLPLAMCAFLLGALAAQPAEGAAP